MLARPERADEADLVGVGFVEHGVVDDQDTVGSTHQRPDFLPERFGIGFETGQESGERIVRRSFWSERLDAGRLARACFFRCADEKVDVVAIRCPRWIHASDGSIYEKIAQDRIPSTA